MTDMGAERFEMLGEAAEADAVEQEQPVADDAYQPLPDGSPAQGGAYGADPADVADQDRGVPLDEEEYPEEELPARL
jgi:hypothetical protein